MRSMFMLAALAAVIGFTGCCGTGGSCKLGGCGLGAGKGLLKAGDRAAARANTRNFSSASNDCGCGSCGSDSAISVSAPYACDGGCGDGGCGGSAPMSAPSSCGCSSCDGGGAVQYSAPVEYAPAQSGDCGSCSSASASTPRGLFTRRAAKTDGIGSNKGMGLLLKGKGIACSQPRSLNPSANTGYVSDLGVVSGGSCDDCSAGVEQTVAQMPGGFLFGGASGERRISSGERRISTGIVSDIRNSRGGCRGGGCAAHKIAGARQIAGGCGKRGCGAAGKLCAKCTKLAQEAGLGHPYGGAIPHTNPAAGQQPQSGIAPQYAYPYYTTRGPRDFLRDNPPSIGY